MYSLPVPVHYGDGWVGEIVTVGLPNAELVCRGLD